MCSTHQDPQQTGLTAQPGAPDPNANYGAARTGDPLSDAIQKESSSNASMSAASPSPGPTKLGSLLKILGPIVEGGTIGAFAGKGHPGGGFGAATEFYNQQRQHQLQMAQFQRQLAQSQAQIQVRRDANDIAQQRVDSEDWGQPVQGQDSDGNLAFFVRNRRTGETKQVKGFSPLDKPDPANTHATAEAGLVNVSRGGIATPVTLPGKPGPPKLNAIPGMPLASGAPLTTSGSPGTPTPLHAPGFGKPQHENDFEQFYSKYLDDNGLADNSANQLKARATYESAGRKPESDGSLTGAAYTKRQSQYIDQLNRGFASSEQQRSKDIKALAKDPTLSADELTSKQRQIEEDNADRKQTLHQRIADSAAAQGINIGDVPDYRAQLTGGGQGAGASYAPPGIPRSSGGKVAGASDVAAWAQRQGISLGAARKQFKAKGYTVQGSPQ